MGYGNEHKGGSKLGYNPNTVNKSAAYSGGTMKTSLGSEQYMFGKGKKMGGYGTGKSGTG